MKRRISTKMQKVTRKVRRELRRKNQSTNLTGACHRRRRCHGREVQAALLGAEDAAQVASSAFHKEKQK